MANTIQFVIEKLPDGKYKNTSALNKHLTDLGEGRYTVSIKKYKKQRSNNQNKFYWSNFIPEQLACFKERFGETYSTEAMHEWNKVSFWGEEQVNEITGEVIKLPGSSAEQSTVEFEEKLENIRQWFRQHMEWELPFPSEQNELL